MRIPPPRPRIVRKEMPPKMTGRDGYLSAREHLRRDFDHRCAYCMIHEQQMGGMEAFAIDHFHPRGKGGSINDYANLYWSCAGCNRIKGDNWPTPTETARGCRFADPCMEQDYGVHFVENLVGNLMPRTPCGEYHVGTLRLNRPPRVERRRERNEFNARLVEAITLVDQLEQERPSPSERAVLAHLEREVASLQAELAIAIPYIPPQHQEAPGPA